MKIKHVIAAAAVVGNTGIGAIVAGGMNPTTTAPDVTVQAAEVQQFNQLHEPTAGRPVLPPAFDEPRQSATLFAPPPEGRRTSR